MKFALKSDLSLDFLVSVYSCIFYSCLINSGITWLKKNTSENHLLHWQNPRRLTTSLMDKLQQTGTTGVSRKLHSPQRRDAVATTPTLRWGSLHGHTTECFIDLKKEMRTPFVLWYGKISRVYFKRWKHMHQPNDFPPLTFFFFFF